VNCARLRQVLDAYVDGELDAATGGEIAQHLAGCAACAALRAERVALSTQVRAGAGYFPAPPALRRRLFNPAFGASRRPSWLQAGALALLTAVAGALAGYRLAVLPGDTALREHVVASHVAALAPAARLTDVAAADRHVVRPWFQGKIDFAPPVRDLSAEGFALQGARLDHVADKRAAAIVYLIRKHYINFFAWRAPSGADEPLELAAVRGFSVATWSAGGLRFAAVSDVEPRELERFARLIRQAP
jgi:anti-sigma factor RsiW